MMKSLAVLSLALILGACAQAPVQMYHWDGYQKNVYTYLKQDAANPSELLEAMNVEAAAASRAGKRLPPGYHAHIAMLMVQLGRYDEASKQLEAEKADFPESAPYMDYLLKQMQGKKS
jgi:hypothetical protein